ncbi:dienelactone hydrolase family protein [bacterium]|nr:dienelactone hydrolase family protein [bacterium]
MRHKIFIFVLLGVLFMNPFAYADDGPDYWQDIDFHAPLDIEILKTESADGVQLDFLRYTSHEAEGKPVRVYAIYGRPENQPREKKLPGLLHIHGGGQTAYPNAVLFYAKRGYAALTFDWTGPTDERGPEITTVLTPSARDSLGPDFASSRIWNTVAMARRGLTLIESRPEVDPGRLGVTGISWGGFTTWLVNGTDRRLKVAVPIYGIGTIGKTEIDDSTKSLLQPLAFAPYQSGPVCFLNGSNDFFGHMGMAEDVWPLLKDDSRRSVTPNENHGTSLATREAGIRWLDHYLMDGPDLPSAPSLRIRDNGDQPTATVTAPGASRCRLFYAFGDRPSPFLYWNGEEMKQTGAAFERAVPNLDPGQTVRVYAFAVYPDGLALSTPMAELKPSDFGANAHRIPRTDSLFDPAQDAAEAWYRSWLDGENRFEGFDPRHEIGASVIDGRPCLQLYQPVETGAAFQILLRAPRCPRRQAVGTDLLSVEINVAEVSSVQIGVYQQDQENIHTTSPATFTPGISERAGWTTILARPSDFHTKDGASPATFDEILEIGLALRFPAKAVPEIGNIRWGH